MVRPVPLSHAEFVESMNPGDRDASFLFSLASRAFAEVSGRAGRRGVRCVHVGWFWKTSGRRGGMLGSEMERDPPRRRGGVCMCMCASVCVLCWGWRECGLMTTPLILAESRLD